MPAVTLPPTFSWRMGRHNDKDGYVTWLNLTVYCQYLDGYLCTGMANCV